MKRSTIAKTFTAAAITALALCIAPMAKADDKGCSNATLKGTFAKTLTGFTTAPPAIAGPVAIVGTLTFDGKGNVTGSSIASINGNIVSVTDKGTYTVKADCTGTFTVLVSPIGQTSTGFFVIDHAGNGIQFIGTDAGGVSTGVALKQFPAQGDWRE